MKKRVNKPVGAIIIAALVNNPSRVIYDCQLTKSA